MSEQDLSQGAVYVSSRLGPLPVSGLALPHAERALAALTREHGAEAASSPLGLALVARAALNGSEATHVLALDGGRMLRDVSSGRYVGTIKPDVYRQPAPVVIGPAGPAQRPFGRLLSALVAVVGLVVVWRGWRRRS